MSDQIQPGALAVETMMVRAHPPYVVFMCSRRYKNTSK